MTNANVLVDYDRVLDAVRRLVAGVGTDQWRSSTPCSEWDVRALVNHVHTGNLLFAAIVRGEPGPDRTRDLLGADPVSSFGEGGRPCEPLSPLRAR